MVSCVWLLEGSWTLTCSARTLGLVCQRWWAGLKKKAVRNYKLSSSSLSGSLMNSSPACYAEKVVAYLLWYAPPDGSISFRYDLGKVSPSMIGDCRALLGPSATSRPRLTSTSALRHVWKDHSSAHSPFYLPKSRKLLHHRPSRINVRFLHLLSIFFDMGSHSIYCENQPNKRPEAESRISKCTSASLFRPLLSKQSLFKVETGIGGSSQFCAPTTAHRFHRLQCSIWRRKMPQQTIIWLEVYRMRRWSTADCQQGPIVVGLWHTGFDWMSDLQLNQWVAWRIVYLPGYDIPPTFLHSELCTTDF